MNRTAVDRILGMGGKRRYPESAARGRRNIRFLRAMSQEGKRVLFSRRIGLTGSSHCGFQAEIG